MKRQIGEYQITTITTGEPWRVNCYLVCHLPSSRQVLIDPGNDGDLIIQAVQKQEVDLKEILITHAHHDHVSAAAALHKRFNVPCHLRKEDARLMRQAHTYALVFDGKQAEPFTSACLFGDEKTLELGGRSIKVMYTPGHTSGSVCYNFGDFIFTGDTLLYQHIGRTDTPGADLEQLISSVSCLVDEVPGETVIFPGHGRKWTMKEARLWWKEAVKAPPQYKRFGGI